MQWDSGPTSLVSRAPRSMWCDRRGRALPIDVSRLSPPRQPCVGADGDVGHQGVGGDVRDGADGADGGIPLLRSRGAFAKLGRQNVRTLLFSDSRNSEFTTKVREKLVARTGLNTPPLFEASNTEIKSVISCLFSSSHVWCKCPAHWLIRPGRLVLTVLADAGKEPE